MNKEQRSQRDKIIRVLKRFFEDEYVEYDNKAELIVFPCGTILLVDNEWVYDPDISVFEDTEQIYYISFYFKLIHELSKKVYLEFSDGSFPIFDDNGKCIECGFIDTVITISEHQGISRKEAKQKFIDLYMENYRAELSKTNINEETK
jgi:hypothetical protein